MSQLSPPDGTFKQAKELKSKTPMNPEKLTNIEFQEHPQFKQVIEDFETKATEILKEKLLCPGEKEGPPLVKTIIIEEIKERKSDLSQIKDCLEKKFQRSLSSIDDAYTERKYVKYCSKFWLEEITNFLKKKIQSKDRVLIQEIFNSLDNIKSLGDFPNYFNELTYYKLLIKHTALMSQENQKILLSRFKNQFLDLTVAYIDSAEIELVFLKDFVNFVSDFKDLETIIVTLKLKDFCLGNLSFHEILKIIIQLNSRITVFNDVYACNTSLEALQSTAKRLQQEKDLFLIDEFKELIGVYIKPVEMQEKNLDNRLVIEIIGKNIVVSKLLSQLEKKLLENSNVEEVRFVGADIIHIDANLESKVWHGRNIAILAKAIRIYNKVIWDVSGKDNDGVYLSNAGTGEDGRGKQGCDGYPGESGGNVLILAEKIENPENFTILSNGGNGGKGQDGGDGKNGVDGKGPTRREFDENFPRVAIGRGSDRYENVVRILRNIQCNLSEEKHVWCTNGCNTIWGIMNSFGEGPGFFFMDIFVEAITKQGNKIIFSYRGQGIAQGFLLYKGSAGQPGKKGGEYGLGGLGGYGGEVTVKSIKDSKQEFRIIKCTEKGREGGNGQGGFNGFDGKNGWDMGYVDYLNIPGFRGTWPQYYGRDEKSRIKLKYSAFSLPNSIWCPYEDKYAQMRGYTNENEIERQYERNNCRSHDRQHHAQTIIRKKNISSDSILSKYSHLISVDKISTLEKLRCDLKYTEQLASQAMKKQEHQKKQTMELKLKRHVNFFNQNKNEGINNNVHVEYSAACQNTEEKIDNLIDKLKNDPLPPENWFALKSVEPNMYQLQQLFSSFEALKNKSNNNDNSNYFAKNVLNKFVSAVQDSQFNLEYSLLQDIEKILIDKYRLAILREIAKELPLYAEMTNNTELTAEDAARYLTEAKENNSDDSHPIIKTLNHYFHEKNKQQHEKISQFYHELQSSDEDHEILERILEMFIWEVGESKEVHPCIKKYYDEHKKFLEKQEQNFKKFENELSQSRNEKVWDLYTKSIKDKSFLSKFKEEVQRDNSLRHLYNSFNEQSKMEHDWKECCKDQDVVKQCSEYIREKGPLSASCRELMAHVFDVNIRVYVEDENGDNRLFLLENHNSSSTEYVHVLHIENKFIQLEVDKNYLKLEEERKHKDNLYAKILMEMESFKHQQEFDNYWSNKSFLVNQSYLKNKLSAQSFDESEKENIKEIIKYFPEEERGKLKDRLGKVSFHFTGQRGIVTNILKRFSNEGKHVSYQELCYLINSILNFNLEDRQEKNTFCWIVAAHPQRNWIDELILLHLENRFKKQLEAKSKWREYLSKIENKDVLLLFGVKLLDRCGSISTECIWEILHLLSNIPNETVGLEDLELSEWPYLLKEKYWLCKLSLLTDWKESEKLSTASFYLLSIENTFGTGLVEKLLDALKGNREELSADKFINILSNFYHEKWNLNEEDLKTLRENHKISEWEQDMHRKCIADKDERNITQLVKLIKGDGNTSKEICSNLSNIADSIHNICDGKYAIGGKSVRTFTPDDIKNWAIEFRIDKIDKGQQDNHKKMLAIIDRAITLLRPFIVSLRDTQRLAVLALLTTGHNILAQVSTGEGKSLIVVAVSIIKALCGEKVDIITSSSVLAKRDAEDNRDIYSLFNINVSHNCSEDTEERKVAYSGSQVVYGDLSNFQRDYLLDRFYGKNILGDRTFENVIVDEVDSMLLDKGNNMLYLSHDLAGLDKLESVYVFIWQWINRPATNFEEISYAFDVEAIKEAIIYDLYGLVKKEDIRKISPALNEQQKNCIWESLVKAEILDGQGRFSNENINDNELSKILCEIPFLECESYKNRLKFLLKECIERERYIHVPNYLKPFIDQHLESWINSAITAFFMEAGQDYVVDVDRSGTSPDLNPIITILDRDTGTDQPNSQWDEALHQFLQLKHGCKLSLQSLKAVFISNVSFFKLYRNLYGLTGTLGSKVERDLLRQLHNVKFVTIPPAKSKQFHEDNPVICSTEEDWRKEIKKLTQELTETKKRSVLIICETVKDVEVLSRSFEGKNVHTYIRDYEEFDIARGKKLEQGQIIFATNLAGRGTDIKITDGLGEAGGLHVCLTYLPSNIRIEQQAFGRAARSGCKGSGQLIIMDLKGHEYTNSRILDLKKLRNTKEIYRLSETKAYYETHIITEESCFKAFKDQYEQLKKSLDDKKVPTEVKEVVLQSCLDKWAFWLDQNSKSIKSVIDEQSKKNFMGLLGRFISQFKNFRTGCNEWGISFFKKYFILKRQYDSSNWLDWVEGNPVQMVKLGKYLSQNAIEIAIKLFDEIIIKEPYFSEAAHYYKAFALSKKIDWEQRPLNGENKMAFKRFKHELREAARLFDEHSKFSIFSAGIIGNIKKKNKGIIQIDAYEKQKKTVASLYDIFSQSINDIFGHIITPQSFVNYEIKEEAAESLYEDLLKKCILKKPKVKNNVPENIIERISLSYGISVEVLTKFLCKYINTEIDEKKFRDDLKRDIKLPSRKEFWKLLLKSKVLREEVKYVVVNSEKLKATGPLSDILQKEIKEQTFEPDKDQIFLNVECVKFKSKDDNNTQQKIDYNFFEKDAFMQAVDKNKYKVLKERGVFFSNRKASIDVSRIESVTFSCYDSITLNDFINSGITETEAEKILSELTEQNVIENSGSSNVYRLKMKFYDIKNFELRSCPVYENAVKALLFLCFAYRIALQKIAINLMEKESSVRLQLMTKPHQNLLLELFEQGIIRPSKVNAEDLEKQLKSMYSLPAAEYNFLQMLSKCKFAPEDLSKLFKHLIERGWIYKHISPQVSKIENLIPVPIDHVVKECVEVIIKSAINPLEPNLHYHIAGSDKRQSLHSFDKDIEDNITKILNVRLKLAEEDAIKNISRTLERSRSTLKALKVPDGHLKSLAEVCGQDNFANIEVHVFFLNGLDHLLQLQEKKWTSEMLCNTAVVIAMAVCQIAIGTAIELCSLGFMTHVGAAFISEGVSDLFFAASALKSGYFTWKSYREHKLESIMITAITGGIGAIFSSGAKVSRFGCKVAGNTGLTVGGKKVAEMTGIQLIKTAGVKVIGKEVAKRITLKTMEGLAFGLASEGVNMIVENYIQSLCESIASDILSDIGREVEEHNVSTTLERAYNLLKGRENTKQFIDDLTTSVFTKHDREEESLVAFYRKGNAVLQGFQKAVEKIARKTNETNKKFIVMKLPLHIINKVAIWVERTTHILASISNKILNDLDKKINTKLNELKKNTEVNPRLEGNEDYESFKKEVTDQWKSLLREKAGRVVSQRIVSPILKEAANHLIRYVGKKMQKSYLSYRESKYSVLFEELKHKYKENLQNEQQFSNESAIDHITQKYHKDLLKLMVKTRNPDLFADIVRENIPMDSSCVNACTKIVQSILKEQGIVTRITITFEGDGMEQEFSSNLEGAKTMIVPLKLIDNHFEFCGSSTLENISDSESKNNCLYVALLRAVPELRGKITPEVFRAEVARCIQQNREIRHYIQQGWHRLPISLGGYGGASARRKFGSKVPDFESSSVDNEKYSDYKEYLDREVKVSNHLRDRLLRYLRLGGIMQRISEKLGLDRNEIIIAGASETQDQSSGKGQDIHAAHLLRGKINPEVLQRLSLDHKELYNELVNFMAHTQNIERWGNEWHKVGGAIDRFQSEYLTTLGSIDFNGSITESNKRNINNLKRSFIALLDSQIQSGKFNKSEKLELRKTRKAIKRFSVKSLLEKGVTGLRGEGMQVYRNIPAPSLPRRR